MKPKFALDLSHEGINLLHRSKGGWSLVGSVELDDPEMGAHLADLRRRAAALESGGFTCKIIIPNSQVLYTTLEAPGPDDISREVQIRSGLDGLTPYPVGELVFDWRAAGERARVAVLARETMDEAETFAVEHRFNPVSFVARPPQGSFSGEPFFGKTRAAAKILGPTERVEPDASPVPRKPPAVEPQTAPAPIAAPDAGQAPQPAHEAAPHSPGDLSWQPPAEPESEATAPTPPPAAPASETPDTPPPLRAPADDPFAELDAIQAELSGNPDAAPAFRSRTSRPQPRPPQPQDATDQPAPPPLAPFPPTSDEADAMPASPQPARKAAASGKSSAPEKAKAPGNADADVAKTPATGPKTERPSAAEPGPAETPSEPAGHATAKTPPPAGGRPSSAPAEDDTPDQPGVAFSTSRSGNGTTITATPTVRGRGSEPDDKAPEKTSTEPTPPAPGQASAPAFRKDATASDRRRAEMAEALSKPLPGVPAKTSAPKAPEKPAGRGPLSGAVRGAAGGLRSFGQRRGPRKDEAKPTDTSMTELMRGAGSSEARISPDQDQFGPDQIAPKEAAKGAVTGDAAAKPKSGTPPTANETPKAAPSTQPGGPKPAAASEESKHIPPAPLDPKADQKPGDKQLATPTPAATAGKPKILSRAPAAPSLKAPASEAEALTVFGARRTEEHRGGRKYLGVILTLLLLLAMAIIAMWSSFFVEDTDPGLFNPEEEATAPETPEPAPGSAPAEGTSAPDAETLPEDTPQQDTRAETESAVDPDAALSPQVLTQEEAEALYAETQIWQRAPETLGEPFTPDLEMAAVPGPGTARSAIADPAAITEPDVPATPGGSIERAAPLPPPPADTVFELDENGLVNPSPDGTVSPSGIVVFEGAPELVPPERPGTPAPPVVSPDDATLDDAALEQAVEQAVEAAAALTTDVPAADALPEVPDVRPAPRPEVVPAPEAPAPDDDSQLDVDPDTPANAVGEAQVVPAAADAASIEAAVDAAASSFVDATDLAVATSPKPTRRPDDIDQIVNAAMARAAAAPPEVAPPAATTTPAIPTSANVANQATTPNALNLREINLLGISGPSNARRALVRMENGRYITVKVGDRLDGGRVTSITSDGLTYQKGSRNYSLQLLPLG